MNTTAQRILAQVDLAAVVDFASELIRIPSFKDEETVLTRWLADYFGSWG